MERDFNRTALADPSFEEFRNSNFNKLKAGVSAFKLFIAHYILIDASRLYYSKNSRSFEPHRTKFQE